VLTLNERINGCMTRSMNGSRMPDDGREIEAFIAYIRFIGDRSPQGVRVTGMGLKPLPPAAQTPDRTRGQDIYASTCAKCHKADGRGDLRSPPAGRSRRFGATPHSIPPPAWRASRQRRPSSRPTCRAARTTATRS
jgi:cytochrome c